MRTLFFLFSVLIISNSLTGCATILSGRTQTLTVETNPPEAKCELTREGRIIGSVTSTPGAVTLNKTKHDISVICKKDGYQDTTGYIKSGTEGSTFGNIAAGGLIGWGIDSAVGADNKYADVTTLSLAPAMTAAQPNNIPDRPAQNLPATLPAPVRTTSSRIVDRLDQLEKLRTQNLISEADYKATKERILKEL